MTFRVKFSAQLFKPEEIAKWSKKTLDMHPLEQFNMGYEMVLSETYWFPL